MKNIFTLLLLTTIVVAYAQPAQTGSLTIFSEDGDKFTLILNGEVINDIPQTNLRVEDLNQPYYNAKVQFENKNLQTVTTNNLMIVDLDNHYTDVTYKIKRDNNNQTKMRYFSSVPVNPRFIPSQNVQVIHYGRPTEVVVFQNQSPNAAVVQTTTTTQVGGNNVGVGINIGGVNRGFLSITTMAVER